MKTLRYLLVLGIFLILQSCVEPAKTQQVAPQAKSLKVNWTDDRGESADETFTTVEIDGCEYLVSYYDRSSNITHKGNCKYCVARMSNQYTNK